MVSYHTILNSVGCCGTSGNIMGYHGVSGAIVGYCGISEDTVGYNGFLGGSMWCCGVVCGFRGNVEFQELLWAVVGFQGVLWGIRGYCEVLWGFRVYCRYIAGSSGSRAGVRGVLRVGYIVRWMKQNLKIFLKAVVSV